MKFNATREVLLHPLSQTAGVVERKQTLPILGNLKLVLRDGQLSVTGTDSEVELNATTAVEMSAAGETTIAARKLVDVVRAQPDGANIDVTVEADHAVLRVGRGRFKLSTLPAADFPELEAVNTANSYTVDTSAFRSLLERTMFAMAQQDVRFYLNGLFTKLGDGALTCVATDGHRLAIQGFNDEGIVGQSREVIVPRKGILELNRLLGSGEDSVTLELGRNHLKAQWEGLRFVTKLIDGSFPDYQAVVPVDTPLRVIADRQTILEALGRAMILSNEKYRGVRLEVGDGLLRLIAHNPEQEEAIEEISVEAEGTDMKFGFNITYLMDAVGALQGEQIELLLKDEASSCLLRSHQHDDGGQHVVMPMRL